MTSLDRTFSFKKVYYFPMLIGKYLEFDMVRGFNVLFNIHRIIARGIQ